MRWVANMELGTKIRYIKDHSRTGVVAPMVHESTCDGTIDSCTACFSAWRGMVFIKMFGVWAGTAYVHANNVEVI